MFSGKREKARIASISFVILICNLVILHQVYHVFYPASNAMFKVNNNKGKII